MITLEEAIKLAEKWRGSKVIGAIDCGDRWAFDFECDTGEVAFDVPNIPAFAKSLLSFSQVIRMFVFKDDGRHEYFFTANALDILESAKQIDLPKGEY